VSLGGGKQHRVSFKEAATWSLAWVTVAMLFAGGLWWYLDGTLGREVANEQTTRIRHRLPDREVAGGRQRLRLADDLQLLRGAARTAEARAAVRRARRHRAAHDHDLRRRWLISQFHWLLYVFGAFLLVTGIKMWWFSEHDPDLEKNPLIRWIRNH
jgi:tellurite resistance protein TerC